MALEIVGLLLSLLLVNSTPRVMVSVRVRIRAKVRFRVRVRLALETSWPGDELTVNHINYKLQKQLACIHSTQTYQCAFLCIVYRQYCQDCLASLENHLEENTPLTEIHMTRK